MKKTLIFHDAKKELPKTSGHVIVFNCNHDGTIYHSALLHYSRKHKLFNALDHDTKEEANSTAITCDFWAYPPTLEKEMQERKVE